MTADRRRTAVFTAYARCRGAFLAALAALTLGAAPAAAEPAFSETETRNAPPGNRLYITANWTFDNAGTNPRITDAVFSTTEYYSEHGVGSGIVYLQAMTDAGLNALASPPPSPFTVDVTVTMANDEGQTAEGTVTFTTTYERAEPEEEEAAPAPTFKQSGAGQAPSGVLVSIHAGQFFDNAGTNPRITDAVFSTTKYYDTHEISRGILWVRARTDAELNALSPPPPRPFTVNVTVTMTNDEGQTAEGTIAVQTDYERVEPEQEEEEATPPSLGTLNWNTLPGHLATVLPNNWSFGTNPMHTDVVFSTTEYYAEQGISSGVLWVRIKTSAELNALPSPPPRPFTVTADVTLTNDEGQTATGRIIFKTDYDRVEPEQEEEEATPPFLYTLNWNTLPGHLAGVSPNNWSFGTNPMHTDVVFSTTEYYAEQGISSGVLWVRIKTSAELNALPSPPPRPFTVTADVTLTNDEGQTATGRIIFKTAYERDTSAAPEPEPESEADPPPNSEGGGSS